VGGTVGKHERFSQKVAVPVGLEKILYLAARDPELRRRLLEDRAATIGALGVRLRPSERAMLEAAPVDELEAMIGRIDASNPRRRRFMNVVAAAATSLAAGTAAMSCVSCGGVGPDVDADAGMDAGTDTDTDSDADSDADSDTGSDSDTVDTDTENYVDAGVGPDVDADSDVDASDTEGAK
jgi:hypothetical protein